MLVVLFRVVRVLERGACGVKIFTCFVGVFFCFLGK